MSRSASNFVVSIVKLAVSTASLALSVMDTAELTALLAADTFAKPSFTSAVSLISN